jgi:hypothetical protein
VAWRAHPKLGLLRALAIEKGFDLRRTPGGKSWRIIYCGHAVKNAGRGNVLSFTVEEGLRYLRHFPEED